MAMVSHILQILKKTGAEWSRDKCPRLGAALAFYSALSIYPLLVIVLVVAQIFLGAEVAMHGLNDQMASILGPDGAQLIQIMLSHPMPKHAGLIASCVNLAVLLFGASGVFGELQDSFNTIWNIQPSKKESFLHLAASRFLSFGMVLATGFLLLISLVITTVLHIISHYFDTLFFGFTYLFLMVNFLVSFAITAALFALMFRILPDKKTAWKTVWPGAILTAILFDTGKFLIGLYLGHASIMTTYGAAGSFVAFLVWIYYSAQILYLGAEFTKVYEGRGDAQEHLLPPP